MKGKKFFVIFSLLTLCTGAFSACDQDPDPPRYPDIIEPDYTTSKEINVFKFNGYYLKGINDNISISYATVRDTLMRGNEIKITVGEGVSYPIFYTAIFNSLTDKLSWENVNTNPYLPYNPYNSSFNLTDQGYLSYLSFIKSQSNVGSSLYWGESHDYSWNLSYDNAGRLIGIDHTDIYDYSDGRHYEEDKTYRNDTIRERLTVKWENDNLKEILIQKHTIRTTNGVFVEETTNNSKYVISYSNNENPARQYPVCLSYSLFADNTLRVFPLIGFLGNGPAYLPSNIRYISDDVETLNYSLDFVTGDVHGTEAILEESNDRGYYKYHYEP